VEDGEWKHGNPYHLGACICHSGARPLLVPYHLFRPISLPSSLITSSVCTTVATVKRADVERRVAASLRELRDLSPAEFVNAMAGIARLAGEVVDAPDVQFLFARRDRPADEVGGWRPLDSHRFGPNAERDDRILHQWYRATRNVVLDPAVHALVRTNGRCRALLRADVADDRTWRRTRIDTLLAESEIRDRLVAGAPIADDLELLLITYRRSGQQRFEADDRDSLATFAGNVDDIGRSIARGYGLIESRRPLTRREREVLQLLLLGSSEADAAARLGLTVRSLHQHVVSIHQKLGVRSRGELVSHFLQPRAREHALRHFAPRLRRREVEVLEGLVRGLSEKEIADFVQASSRAVHHLVGSIYRKLGVHTRASLLARVLSASARCE
jgi:DNA-binding NarL/FixJ family response regulator